MAFGQVFGQLIRSKRGIEGMTQQALAVAAFGDERYKTRISELENGKVSKPQTKTIDALVVALNISDEELNTVLNRDPHPRIFDSLMDFFEQSGDLTMDIDIVVNENGRASFLHDRPLVVDINRLEYFCEERSLVLLESSGRRRPAGIELPEKLDQYVRKALEFQFTYINEQERRRESGSIYPIKIVP